MKELRKALEPGIGDHEARRVVASDRDHAAGARDGILELARIEVLPALKIHRPAFLKRPNDAGDEVSPTPKQDLLVGGGRVVHLPDETSLEARDQQLDRIILLTRPPVRGSVELTGLGLS